MGVGTGVAQGGCVLLLWHEDSFLGSASLPVEEGHSDPDED